jgi:predicted RNase H-like HicB family nuclease
MADISYYLSLPYTIVLRRDEDGDFFASIAELDGCLAHGSDETEALRNIREAQAAWLEAALSAGQDIPAPEIEDDLPSGKFVVRLPRSLHHKLNKLAKKDDVSLNQIMVMAATEHVARRDVRTEMRHAHMAPAEWRRTAVKWSPERPGSVHPSEYFKRIQQEGLGAKAVDEDQHPPSRGRKG